MSDKNASRIVEVPGARLYAESAGSGPPLVLVSGGGGDAGMYENAVPLLVERYTVITFDRRGNSRSPFTAPDAAIDATTQAGDVVAVLDAYGIDRAYLFGNSGGGVIGLEVLAHHGDRLVAAVVHEPPVIRLLPEGSSARQELLDINRLAVEKSLMRGYAAFGALTVPNLPAVLRTTAGQIALAGASRVGLAAGSAFRRISGGEPSTMTRQLGNADLLLTREMPALCFDYRPEIDALRKVEVPWRLATGRDSAGRSYCLATEALAHELNMVSAQFPGGHVAYLVQPEEFAARLCQLFEEMTS
ncbi:alpha/beta fold hydrolase [Nocardia nepalensis]|uniref:alpha/beta fold hydrolase n=1 Tax=Nocardia nepalensis TaxID=3375448 RepID=UPI003B67926A